MQNTFLFSFKTDISGVQTPKKLNSPFEISDAEIAAIACKEFQQYIADTCSEWDHDFKVDKGKMFGVLVVRSENERFYIATVSGKLKGTATSSKFIPSVFDDSLEDYKINKGMSELTALSQEIKNTKIPKDKNNLIEERKSKSNSLQKWLFDNYQFLNINGETKSVTKIFEEYNQLNPPAAAGECAAPKLLNYAFKNNLTPLAIAEFWWGISPKSEERLHIQKYPACENKCRPILEYMLKDNDISS